MPDCGIVLKIDPKRGCIDLHKILGFRTTHLTFWKNTCSPFLCPRTDIHPSTLCPPLGSPPYINVQFFGVFSCDQAALQMVFSVCLSVHLSVCPSVRPSHLFDYVPIIVSSWNFQNLLPMTEVTSVQEVKVRGQRSRSQRSQPNLTVSGL